MKDKITNILMGSVSGCNVEDVYIWMNSFILNCNLETDGIVLTVIKDKESYNKILRLVEDNNWTDNIDVLPIETDLDGNELKELNINTGVTVDGNKYLIHHYRFNIQWLLLKHKYYDSEVVMFTDVRDVVFNKDPFSWIESTGVTVAGENIQMSKETWNSSTMERMYGKRALIACMLHEVLCCGVMGGDRKSMMNISKIIYYMSCGFQVADQMALNLLYVDGEDWIIPSSDVYQVHTNWNYDKEMLIDESKYKKTGEGYPVVHQYDRIPELKELYVKKYGMKKND